MSRVERVFLRSMMVGLLGLVLLGATWGPTKLAQLVLGAGLPQSGEVVPRQISYRGYVEQNGTPLTSAAVPMRFRLYGIDGGVLHEESQPAVVVQQGSFSVELGDATTFAPEVMRQNFLELEVAIGSPPVPLAGRQRLLAAPFAQGAAVAWAAAGSLEARLTAVEEAIVPTGAIIPFGSAIPAGWIECDGRAVAVSAEPRLFAAIGFSFGGAGTTFVLPDLRDRFARGAGSESVGLTGGLDSHVHSVTLPEDGRRASDINWGSTPWAGGPNPARGNSTPTTSASSNLPPYQVVRYAIKR